MEQQQQELRRAAAQAFMTSLEQLEQTFEPATSQGELSHPEIQQTSSHKEKRCNFPPDISISLDVASLEDAVADIEQFTKKKQNAED